jgi:hypothetical protein
MCFVETPARSVVPGILPQAGLSFLTADPFLANQGALKMATQFLYNGVAIRYRTH